MKRILFSQLFDLPSDRFLGDNLTNYLPAKYLWHLCNIKKQEFYEPLFQGSIKEDVSLSFIFLKQHPQNRYFKKPEWIENFLEAEVSFLFIPKN